ncbi:ferredoxin [Amycolatopsis deserti]|uniref:Ferredoxin n=1 Tax=Amycolatopsis deserti TaxID=185696 RepID=A0ABQ3IGM5_9PSEU|nr:PDR/VanB family oxidoreductase [Amycolatopsis deserti]GHE80734.1 ferredoxin [Amycolatopsis deserti]
MSTNGGPAKAMTLRVRTRSEASASVAAFELEHPEGADLPPWEPGAHIDVHLPGERTRQYSLCGDPADRSSYRIGVLREPAGRGGSAWIHDSLREGDPLPVTGPRNHFRLTEGPRYLFLAGGVGVTPILPMLRECESRQAEWRLVYLGRSRDTMAFLDELRPFGDRVRIHCDDESGIADIGGLVGTPDRETLIYACGPEGLLREVERVAESLPAVTLHVERFAPKDPGLLGEQGPSFTVTFEQSGITADVKPGESILDVAEQHGLQPDYSCREGTCGTCEVAIVRGRADHRDSVLSPEEQDAGETMMICVSRSLTPELVIDL